MKSEMLNFSHSTWFILWEFFSLLLIFQSFELFKYGDFGQSVAKKAIYHHRVTHYSLKITYYRLQQSLFPHVSHVFG